MVTTGTITGTVKDETGGVLVGDVHKKPFYWVLNFLLLAGIVGLGALLLQAGVRREPTAS